MSEPLYALTHEDSTTSVLGRLCSLSGSGEEVKPGEGYVCLQADVSAIACRVYDLGTDRDAATGTEVTPAPTLTPAANVFNALRTVGWPVARDRHGYNFRHDIGAAFLADPGEWRLFEYRFTFADGGVAFREVRVYTRPVVQS